MSYRRRDEFYHLDFRWQKRRYRIGTGIRATDQNEQFIKDWDASIRREIKLGTFVYDKHFPGQDPAAQMTVNLSALFGPCVYVITEAGGDVLYVGMSIRGIVRLGHPGHSGVTKSLKHHSPSLKVYFSKSHQAAAELESSLILRHRPLYNSTVDLKYVQKSKSRGVSHVTNGEVLHEPIAT